MMIRPYWFSLSIRINVFEVSNKKYDMGRMINNACQRVLAEKFQEHPLKENKNTSPSKKTVAEYSDAKNDPTAVKSGGFSLTELIDIEQLGPVLKDFCKAMGIASAIIDLEGNVLMSTHWQRICTDFHRTDARARARCIESDTVLAANLEKDKLFSIYHCKNGLTDAASPIIVEGCHVANFFVGQFFTEAPDRDYFKQQARKFGFDTADYLGALDEVPIVSQEKLPAILGFLRGFAHMAATLGLERIKANKAEHIARVRAEDAERAKKELTHYKAHIENLVADRTERLKESEAYSRLILQSVAEGIFGTDADGRCTYANDAAQKMLGYDTEELIGQNIYDLFHHSNEDGSPHLRGNCPIYLAHTQGITSFRRDEIFWRKDGSFFDTSYTSVPQRRGEATIGSVVVFRDITARKKVEDALRESEYHLKSILMTTNEGFLWVNNEAHTVSVNDTMCKIFSRPREDILGRTLFEFLDEENRAILKEQLRRRAAGQTGVYEISLSRPDGSKVLCLFHATPLYDKNGVKTGSFAMVSDITHRKKMEEELIVARDKAEAATRAKGDFLANMSHEIRTPMNAVMGMTHLALQTDLTPKQRDYLHKIQISANSLLGVINDILDFSKIEAGKMRMESIDFNLDEVLENLSTLIAIKLREKEGIEVLFNTGAEVPRRLVGDPLRLGQILVNLANNAIKFTERGEIVVSTKVVSQANHSVILQFSVRDTGIGLTKEQMAQLFTAFSQADTSITRRYGGSGLGLSICQRLVKMMGGKIWVESTYGTGSTFYFTAVFRTALEPKRVCHIPPPELRGLKALVVDDNATSREIFQSMLESFSFDVTLAASGEEGLEEIGKSVGGRPYAIVVMDWKLPGIDGIEASKRIKKDLRLTRIPVIILVSAYAREEILWRAEAAGLDGFLIKPINASVMFDTIMNALAKEGGKEAPPVEEEENKQAPDVRKSLKGARVLVVEDNEINQQVAMEILAAAGVTVSLAANGQEAVDAVHTNRFDAVLMDLQMPVMDGYTATRTIRQDAQFKGLPIIAMTAHAMVDDPDKSRHAGMNGHITKPIDPEILYATLADWISVAIPEGEAGSTAETTPQSAMDNCGAVFPAVPEEKPFPASLDGFDLPSGLGRLQGNQALYRKLLIRFGDRYAQRTSEIRHALDAGDYPNVHKLAHEIKGLAGNLSASQLHAAATALDQLVRHGDSQNPPPADALATAFSVFESRMEEALGSVRQLSSSAGDPNPEPVPGSMHPLAPDLAREAAIRLREAAEMGDVSALTKVCEEMAARSTAFVPYLGRITRMKDDFDFEGILGLADDLDNDLEKREGK